MTELIIDQSLSSGVCAVPEKNKVVAEMPQIIDNAHQHIAYTSPVNKMLDFLGEKARFYNGEAHYFVAPKDRVYHMYHYLPEMYSPAGFKALVLVSESVISSQLIYALIDQNNEIDRIVGYLGKNTKFNISKPDLNKFSIVTASTLNYFAQVLLESQK